MKTADWIRALAVTALMASACGGSTPTAGNTPSPSAATSPSASPTANPCPPPSNRCLALVTLRGSDSIVVRDITDIAHPTTLSNAGPVSMSMFVSATELSYSDDTGIVRAPLAGAPKTRLTTSHGLALYSYAWSPDGRTLAYLTQSGSGIALHELRGGSDRVLEGAMPAIPAIGCESQFCPIADTLDIRVSYSPDGGSISLVASVLKVNVFRLWSSDGKVLSSSDSQARSMSTWSGNSLYFRDAGGVEMWRDGTTSPFLPGVVWIRPKASPIGGQIVYETRDAHHLAHTFVVDTATRKIRELPKGRFDPWFLTSRYVWYQGQRSCVAADHCPTGWSAISSGKTYIYDLVAGTETESIITGVYDVWPHPA